MIVVWQLHLLRVWNGVLPQTSTRPPIALNLAPRPTDSAEEPIFLWNVFPLHPHEPDDPFSNRTHNSHERRAGEELLRQLILLLNPRRLIAIGNDAELTAHRLANDHEVTKVRHPSYGGQTQFLRQVRDLYDVSETEQKALL